LGADRNPFPVQCLTTAQALARFSDKVLRAEKIKGEETGERAKRMPVLIFQRMPFHPLKTANGGPVT